MYRGHGSPNRDWAPSSARSGDGEPCNQWISPRYASACVSEAWQRSCQIPWDLGTLQGGGADEGPVAVWSEQVQDFDGVRVGRAEPVPFAGVELGDLPGTQCEFAFSNDE